jgi:hypothetical protein
MAGVGVRVEGVGGENRFSKIFSRFSSIIHAKTLPLCTSRPLYVFINLHLFFAAKIAIVLQSTDVSRSGGLDFYFTHLEIRNFHVILRRG